MGVPPLGPGSTNLDAWLRLAGVPTPGSAATPSASSAAISEDTIAALLQILAIPQIAELISAIEQRVLTQNPAQATELLQAASSAVAAGNLPVALASVRELITISPQQAETINAEPSLAPIQREVVNLVREMTFQARTQADGSVAAASQAIANGGSKRLPGSEVELPTVLALATRFIDSGRLTDYLMAAGLAQAVITHYETAPGLPAPGLPAPGLPAPGLPALAAAPHLFAKLPELLARPEIDDLVFNIEQRVLPRNPAQTEELLQAASLAVVSGNFPVALAKVKELVTLNPHLAETISAQPSLQAIQRDVVNLVRQMTTQGRTEAEERVANAAQAIAVGGSKKLAGSEVDVQTVLSLANHFLESGGLANYLMAAEFAQIVIAQYTRVPDLIEPIEAARIKAPARARAPAATPPPKPMLDRLKHLWLRVPLLILLLAWLGLGLAFGIGSLLLRKFRADVFDPSIASIGFSIWGLGFLALVGFGFYMRVRHVRF